MVEHAVSPARAALSRRVALVLSLSRRGDAADKAGAHAPVAAVSTHEAQFDGELKRLRARYPLRIAGPVSHDPDTGLLSRGEE